MVNVLIACEFSGRVRDAFTARGHYAMSADFEPSETSGPHYRGDVRDLLDGDWDLMVAFPPCTNLSKICAKDWPQKQADGRMGAALEFTRELLDAPIPHIALENPVGRINTAIRKPEQIIQPYMFGEPWKKQTCLWLKNLPPLIPSDWVTPRGHWVDGGTRVAHKERDYGDARYGSNTDIRRKAERSRTFQGIADAMADQWGLILAFPEIVPYI